MPRFDISDRTIENVMGRLLRIGVLLATAVVFIGAVRYLWRNGDLAPDYAVFAGPLADSRSQSGISPAFALRGSTIITLGLIILVATPVARVVFAVIGFAMERDRLYTVVSLVVLAILLFGLFGVTT
jgi:uncharacterized membrane protein